jgi:protein-S-isoprenylcysteine O-methyltransferase Ste14
MDPLTFTILYISAAYLIIGVVWITTTPWQRYATITMPSARILQIVVNFMHIISGLLFPLPIPFYIPVRSFGLTLLTVGTILAIWAKLTMKTNWGFPGIHTISIQKYLVKDGPFQFTRNPIYVGIILMSFGMAIALKSAFIFLIFLVYSYFYNKIQKEEDALAKHFGKDYIEYCTDVPRFI